MLPAIRRRAIAASRFSILQQGKLSDDTQQRSLHVEARLEQLGITLPAHPKPKANYNSSCAHGDLLLISGHLPVTNEGTLLTGVVGPASGGVSVDDAYVAARHVGLNILATLKQEIGDLDRVEQVVKLFGIVQSHADFKQQHLVVNGCSDLMIEVFGKPQGYHARSAIGTNTLPFDAIVEIEAMVRIKPYIDFA
mmetsp:Transcript_38328/g.74984  ORF Transcript_38328/g.74984 Transcript_38328/m.74984 type:complete len:194 (+) Transcript_38328:41-622(+)